MNEELKQELAKRGWDTDDRGEELKGVPRLSPEFKARIKGIADSAGGWTVNGNDLIYLSLAEELLDQGLSEVLAVHVLNEAFWAAANEFGA